MTEEKKNGGNGLRFERRLSLDNLLLLAGMIGAVAVFWASEKAADERLAGGLAGVKAELAQTRDAMFRQSTAMGESLGKLEDRLRAIEIRMGPTKP